MCAGVCLSGAAQQDEAWMLQLHDMRYQPQFHIGVGVGANVDFAKSSDNPASTLFGVRPKAVPALDLRLVHLFAPRFGWYADLRFKFFKCSGEYGPFGDQVGEALLAKLQPGLDRLHLAYSVGGVFRIEGDRWQCYPRIGIGQSYYGTNRTSENILEGDTRQVLESDGSAICLDFGISTQYHLTRRWALFFDVLYQQPLTRAKSYLLVKNGEADAQEFTYRSSTVGRELNVSVGVNVCFDLRRR